MTIKELKKGEYFTLKKTDYPNVNHVFVKGDYDRASKAYSCYKYSDTNNERFFKGDKEIFTEFIF